MELDAAKLMCDELNARPNGLSYLVGYDVKWDSYYVFVDRGGASDPNRIVVRTPAGGKWDGWDEACAAAMAINPTSWRVIHRPGESWAPHPR